LTHLNVDRQGVDKLGLHFALPLAPVAQLLHQCGGGDEQGAASAEGLDPSRHASPAPFARPSDRTSRTSQGEGNHRGDSDGSRRPGMTTNPAARSHHERPTVLTRLGSEVDFSSVGR